MKKKTNKLLVLLALVALGGLLFLLGMIRSGKISLHGKYEDITLALIDVGHLVLDLLSWPVNFIRALLP